ncbi:High affinity nitrate transporter 2.5 [Hibiscus syriacus]|uniref:High affinity nitrate transporter 2.5 n=1 Tax=Hibiscus syriacus TaxID=106335 RepID=A0A6A3ATL4_HIBSY|nr:high affinity nitrate transporter 2.7-like [Hibiscus syriacus]KAE8707626.1 High affinity nitrate transporter 2.5 [Hibiscus syriacus]
MEPSSPRNNRTTEFHPFSTSPPHMLAFHLAWLSLFSCFFSTFSIPPLIPVIRRNLNLSAADVDAAGTAAFVSSIFSRLAMGPVCDLVGPRVASATLSLLIAPIVLATAFISSPTSFILVRFLVGFCLGNFVANQFWMSSKFSTSVVGLANGFAASWASMGAGVAQLIMPLLFSLVKSFNVPENTAWRVVFVVPATFQAITAVLVLVYGQELPRENHENSKKVSSKPNESFLEVLFSGLMNYRGWILGLIYAFSFGVEMTMDNIIAQYFYYIFGVNLEVAGTIAACFGLTNIFARPMGGVVSDWMAKWFGIRGRLWGLWVVQTVAGLLCVSMGRVDSLGGSIALMCVFSVFVQASSGLTFGIVPFVSKRSLGVISGMTGSGGTLGAVVTQTLLFSGDKFSTQTGISIMGLMMIVCSLPITLIYFPRWGGMFCAPHFLHQVPTHEQHYRLLVPDIEAMAMAMAND